MPPPMTPERVATLTKEMSRYDRELDTGPAFAPGDKVKTMSFGSRGHTRLPQYARGREGRIESFRGVHILPDTNMAGDGPAQPLYTVSLSPMGRRLGHFLSAFIAITEQKFERALSEAEAAIDVSPYNADTLASLSQISIMAGKPTRALEWIDRAASLDRNPQTSQELAFYRGWALAVDGKLEESLAALKEDHRRGSFFTPAMKAIVLNRLGRTEDAAAELKNALAIKPKFTQANWRELFFYSDPTIVEGEIADLASLGLPKK